MNRETIENRPLCRVCSGDAGKTAERMIDELTVETERLRADLCLAREFASQCLRTGSKGLPALRGAAAHLINAIDRQ